ncbi:MAG: ATP-binding protein [Longimicrobiales bacterium]
MNADSSPPRHPGPEGAGASPRPRSRSLTGGEGADGLAWLGRDELRRWALGATGIAAAAYGGVLIVNLLLTPGRTVSVVSQSSTVVVLAVAFGLLVRGRLETGIGLGLFAIWVEVHSLIILEGVASGSLILFPVLVMAVGLLTGGRGALWMAGASTVTLVLATTLVHAVIDAPGRDLGWEVYLLSITVVCMFSAAAAIQLGVRAFRRATAAARAGERRVSDLIRQAPDGVLALDAGGRILSSNPVADRLLGSTESRLVGRPILDVLPRLVAGDGAAVRRLVEQGGPGTLPAKLRDPSYGTAWVEVTSGDLEPGHGDAVRRLTLRDVTERRRAEVGERMLRDQLEHARRLEAMGRLAGGVAHDFNNLLTVVGVSGELLAADADPETAALAGDILIAQRRATELIQHLISFARKEVIRPQHVRPHQVVEDLLPLLRRLLPDTITLDTAVDESVEPVFADPEQMRQVVLNLVTNARDAVEDGGTVTLGVSGPGGGRSWVGRTLSPVPPRYVEFWVGDDGTGMDEETQSRIFEPFFTTRPPGRGTGLGLSVVDGITNQNGGSVEVETWVDEGTIVRVFWPAARSGSPRAAGEGDVGTRPGAALPTRPVLPTGGRS